MYYSIKVENSIGIYGEFTNPLLLRQYLLDNCWEMEPVDPLYDDGYKSWIFVKGIHRATIVLQYKPIDLKFFEATYNLSL